MAQIRSIWKKIICTCILFLTLTVSICYPAFAAENDTRGSMTIVLENLGTKMQDVSFRVYHVADLQQSADNYWALKESLSDSGVNVNKLSTAEESKAAAEKLAAVIEKSGITPVTVTTDKSGKAYIGKLKLGLYLVIQNEPDASEYGIVAPFLTDVPRKTEAGVEYHTTVYPKGEKPYEPDTPDTPPETPDEPETPDKPETPDTPTKTGDTARIDIAAAMLIVSGIMGALLIIQKKKEKKITK